MSQYVNTARELERRIRGAPLNELPSSEEIRALRALRGGTPDVEPDIAELRRLLQKRKAGEL